MIFSTCHSIAGRGGIRRHTVTPTSAEQSAAALERRYGHLWSSGTTPRSRAERARVEHQIRRDARVGQDFRPRWQRRADPLRSRS